MSVTHRFRTRWRLCHIRNLLTFGVPQKLYVRLNGVNQLNDPDVIRTVLTTPGTWAVMGLSNRPERTAYRIAEFVQGTLGHRIIPIHPAAETVHGAQGYASLADIPDGTTVDVVQMFLRSELVGAVVDEAIEQRQRLGITTLWLQLGVIDEEAAARALAIGLNVVMDTCPKIEYPKLDLADELAG